MKHATLKNFIVCTCFLSIVETVFTHKRRIVIDIAVF